MRPLSTSTNITIFLLFFGISLLEAVRSRDYWSAAFWIAIGLVFLGANWLSRRASRGSTPSAGQPVL